jgi:hypothetical protein
VLKAEHTITPQKAMEHHKNGSTQVFCTEELKRQPSIVKAVAVVFQNNI